LEGIDDTSKSQHDVDLIAPDILHELPEPLHDVLPGIDLDLALPSPTLASGSRVAAQLIVSNRTNDEITIATGQPLLAVIVLPGTRSVVGAYTGAVRGTGRHLRLSPGAADSVPVTVAAWGRGSTVDQSELIHEDLQPGTYGVVVSMPIYDQRHENEQQQAWSSEVPIEVIAGST
jgi:hypothetical protein